MDKLDRLIRLIMLLLLVALLTTQLMTKKESRLLATSLESQISEQQKQLHTVNERIERLSQDMVSRGNVRRNKKVFEATAYCDRGLTATGTQARAGVIAVDPNVIPLGSKVLVNGVEYTAEDTGGAVKGNIIDIWLDSEQACFEWGRRNVEVVRL